LAASKKNCAFASGLFCLKFYKKRPPYCHLVLIACLVNQDSFNEKQLFSERREDYWIKKVCRITGRIPHMTKIITEKYEESYNGTMN